MTSNKHWKNLRQESKQLTATSFGACSICNVTCQKRGQYLYPHRQVDNTED